MPQFSPGQVLTAAMLNQLASTAAGTTVLVELYEPGGLTSNVFTLTIPYGDGNTVLLLDGAEQADSDYAVTQTTLTLGSGITPSDYERLKLRGSPA